MGDETRVAAQTWCEDHHWVSIHQPDMPVWVRQCSQCGRFDADDMRAEIAKAAAAKSKLDWRARESTVLSDLYDGDRHLILGDGLPTVAGRRHRQAVRKDTTIPHPLLGVRYADGVCTKQQLTELTARGGWVTS